MNISGWKLYKNMLIPASAPHEKPSTENIKNIQQWPKNILLARYTTDFDCETETEWWYCIKDEPINLDDMKAKKRYEIARGLKNFEIRKINPMEYAEDLLHCYQQASKRYGGYVNPEYEKGFIDGIRSTGKNTEYYAAFCKETGEIAGYAMTIVHDEWVNFAVAKFIPEHMKERVAAAMIYTIVYDYINLAGKRYVCDGERTIFHKTNMQDYLENLFGFRKAYCKLNIIYRPVIGLAVKVLFPFRNLLRKIDNGIFSKISSILMMEEIARKG